MIAGPGDVTGSRPLRITHVAWLSQIGGGELFLQQLLASLDPARVRQRLAVIGPEGPVVDHVRSLGIPVRRFPKRTRLGLGSLLRLTLALRRWRPDIVQTHGEAGAFWGIAAARLAGCPKVAALLYQSSLPTTTKRRIMARLLRRADSIVSGSDAVRGALVAELDLDPACVSTIHCGIDPEPFYRVAGAAGTRRSGAGDAPLVVTVGRLVHDKGHAVLLRAFRQLLSHQADARLCIVGDGPVRDELETLAGQLGIAERVELRGTVFPTTDVLSRADLFVFPSLEEPQGLAVLEAFAAGVPVVASRTGGIVEMVEHGVEGLLVDPGDPRALAEAMARLLERPDLAETLVCNARRRVDEFDIRRIARRYEELFDRLATRDASTTGATGTPDR